MGTWTLSLACWVAKYSVFRQVPLQHVLQWWPHMCSTLCWWTQSESLLSSAASVMVLGAIGYNIRSHLLHIEGNLNSNRYIREVLQPEVLPLLQATRHGIFQQDNARPHVARIVQVFFQRRWVSLLPWPAHSPDMSPIEHVWSMVGWLVTYSSGSSSTYSWCFVDSYTNCVEGHSPWRYPWPFWSHATTLRLFDCSTWRLHTILKSHAHRPCTVL